MYTIARINQEINSCQSELVVLFPRQFSMLGEGEVPVVGTEDSRTLQRTEVVEHVSITINLIGSLEAILTSIRAGEAVRVNGESITGAQFAFLLLSRMIVIRDASVTNKVSSEAVMSSVIATMAAIVQTIMPPAWRQHNAAIMKYMRTSILYDTDLTAPRNITTFYERLADRISSIGVLCFPPLPNIHNDVFMVITHMRFYIPSYPVPKHSVIVLLLKQALCGNSLLGDGAATAPSTIRKFSDTEFTSLECKNMMRLFYLMDTLIGLKRKYTRQGSNEVLEACIKTGKSICSYFKTTSTDPLLKSVCRNIITSLTTAHSRFSEHHTFEQRFSIIMSEVHAGLSSVESHDNTTLKGIIEILNQAVVLNLQQIKFDLEQIGFMYTAEEQAEDDDDSTPIHRLLNLRYDGTPISVKLNYDPILTIKVISVDVDETNYPTPNLGAWLVVLAIITDEIASPDDAADELDPTLPPFTE